MVVIGDKRIKRLYEYVVEREATLKELIRKSKKLTAPYRQLVSQLKEVKLMNDQILGVLKDRDLK